MMMSQVPRYVDFESGGVGDDRGYIIFVGTVV